MTQKTDAELGAEYFGRYLQHPKDPAEYAEKMAELDRIQAKNEAAAPLDAGVLMVGSMIACIKVRDAEIAALREKNSELNRRAQTAEAGVLAAVRGAGEPNLGRALANAAVGPLRRENDELRALCKEQAEALSERDRICKDANAKWDDTSAAMKRAADAIEAVCAEGRRDD